MGQRALSSPTPYLREVERLLVGPLALSLPIEVLEVAAQRAFARGLKPRDAAVQICHEHIRCLCQQLIERDEAASDLVELAIASRIDECARLAGEMDQDLLDLLPDLPFFLHQPCFSDEFQDMVAHIATWHDLPDHRWTAPEAEVSLPRRTTA